LVNINYDNLDDLNVIDAKVLQLSWVISGQRENSKTSIFEGFFTHPPPLTGKIIRQGGTNILAFNN